MLYSSSLVLMDKVPINPTYIARYRFENNGNDSIHGYNCIPVGTVSYNTIHKEGAYSVGFGSGFAGSTNYLSCPASLRAAISNKTNYMIDFWVYATDNFPGGGGDTWWENNSLYSYIQTIYGGLRVCIQGHIYGPFYSVLPTFQWVRVTLRSTYLNYVGTTELYVNNILVGSSPHSGDLGTVCAMSMGRYGANTLLDNVYYINSSNLSDLP